MSEEETMVRIEGADYRMVDAGGQPGTDRGQEGNHPDR